MLVNATEPPGATEAGASAVIVTSIWLLFAVTLFLQAFGNVAALAALAGISTAAAASRQYPDQRPPAAFEDTHTRILSSDSLGRCRARSLDHYDGTSDHVFIRDLLRLRPIVTNGDARANHWLSSGIRKTFHAPVGLLW